MGKRRTEELTVGEDSFLDTVANLVGILIILVVIVGARSYSDAKGVAAQELQDQMERLKIPLNKSENLEDDIEKQQQQLERYELELAFREAERTSVLDRVTMAKQLVAEQTEELSEDDQVDLSVQQEMNELQKKLAELMNQQGEIPQGERETAVLQHLPTPMAKTVFGREVHVMLSEGKVSVIPWDALIESLKLEARRTVERNSQKQSFVNQLGPIDGFIMKYGLLSKSGLVSNGSTTAVAKMVELDRFELEPTAEVIKESVQKSLDTGGRLRSELSMSTSK